MSLTTVRQLRLEMGKVATQLLMREMEERAGHIHRQILLTPSLVTRDTTAPRTE
jgi:DNA-binding LacI/PurR family transcriptional regulator